MSNRVITTAGRAAPAPAAGTAKRDVIARIRTVLRNQAATDAETDDAIEALTELARTED